MAVIRKATETDIPRLLELYRQLYLDSSSAPTDSSPEQCRRALSVISDAPDRWLHGFLNFGKGLKQRQTAGLRTAGDAFLQQQVGRLNQRRAMEAVPHRTIMHRIRESHQRHTLMVSHIATHHRHPLIFRKPNRSIIERLIETKAPQSPFLLQAREIFHSSMRQVHRR